MRKFNNIATLVKTKRLAHPQGLSQSDLSHILGYKNGQFISNVERALCNIPFKMIGKLCRVLNIESEEIKAAMLKDHEDTLDAYIAMDAEKIAKENNEDQGFVSAEVMSSQNSVMDQFNKNEGIGSLPN